VTVTMVVCLGETTATETFGEMSETLTAASPLATIGKLVNAGTTKLQSQLFSAGLLGDGAAKLKQVCWYIHTSFYFFHR